MKHARDWELLERAVDVSSGMEEPKTVAAITQGNQGVDQPVHALTRMNQDEKTRASQNNPQNLVQQPQYRNGCFNCDWVDHIARVCPLPRAQPKRQQGPRRDAGGNPWRRAPPARRGGWTQGAMWNPSQQRDQRQQYRQPHYGQQQRNPHVRQINTSEDNYWMFVDERNTMDLMIFEHIGEASV